MALYLCVKIQITSSKLKARTEEPVAKKIFTFRLNLINFARLVLLCEVFLREKYDETESYLDPGHPASDHRGVKRAG